jgi:hypothetical protein
VAETPDQRNKAAEHWDAIAPIVETSVAGTADTVADSQNGREAVVEHLA